MTEEIDVPEKPDRRRHGRIVVTLRYDIPRDEWGKFETDGVDVLRREVDLLSERAVDKHQFGDMMADLFDGSVGWDIEATK